MAHRATPTFTNHNIMLHCVVDHSIHDSDEDEQNSSDDPEQEQEQEHKNSIKNLSFVKRKKHVNPVVTMQDDEIRNTEVSTDQHDIKNDEPPNKRLRFKRHNKNKIKNFANSKKESLKTKETSPNAPISRMHNSTRNNFQYEEIGESINGYKIIGKPGTILNNIPKVPVNIDGYELLNNLQNEYQKGHEFLKAKQIINDFIIEEESQHDKKIINYEDYLKNWQSNKKSLIWPEENNDYDLITVDSLKKFFKNNDKEIIKNERVRWHPDKMMTVLLKNGIVTENQNEQIVKSKVTDIFQKINHLYQNSL